MSEKLVLTGNTVASADYAMKNNCVGVIETDQGPVAFHPLYEGLMWQGDCPKKVEKNLKNFIAVYESKVKLKINDIFS